MLDPLEFERCIAVAGILMPQSRVRLCARRETMSDETQVLVFQADTNSIFYGERLLTTPRRAENQDRELFKRLVIKPLQWELNDSLAPATVQEQGQFYNATAG